MERQTWRTSWPTLSFASHFCSNLHAEKRARLTLFRGAVMSRCDDCGGVEGSGGGEEGGYCEKHLDCLSDMNRRLVIFNLLWIFFYAAAERSKHSSDYFTFRTAEVKTAGGQKRSGETREATLNLLSLQTFTQALSSLNPNSEKKRKTTTRRRKAS